MDPVLGAMMAMKVIGGIMGASAQEEQAEQQAHAMKMNADFADFRAEETLSIGELQAQRYSDRINQLLGSQAAAQAASGLDLDVGTTARVREQTRLAGDIDVNTIRENAERSAQGLRMGAQQTRQQAGSVVSAGQTAARNTMFMSALDSFQVGYQGGAFKKKKPASNKNVGMNWDPSGPRYA